MNTFSIEYPEYHIAGLLQDHFTKTNNYSVSIPLSRQQKYYDLLLFNANNKKCLAIQVKSSRTYFRTETTDKQDEYFYYSWLNNFKPNIYSDFYFIFFSYPLFDTHTFKPKTALGIKVLVFDTKEMLDLLSNIKTTKSGNPDMFFGFGFNMDNERIFGTRGFSNNPKQEFTSNLFHNK
jgi:hypothetical protein